MTDYLINVAIAGRWFWFCALLIFAAGAFAEKSTKPFTKDGKGPAIKVDDEHSIPIRSLFNQAASLFLLLGIVVGLFSPSNTPKLKTDYNRSAEFAQQQRLNEQQSSSAPAIQDISRRPSSTEERAASSVDMRERVDLSGDEDGKSTP